VLTLSADRTAYTTVTLDHPIAFDGAAAPHITATSPKELVAVVLVKVTAGDSAPGVAFVRLHNDPQFTTAMHFFGFVGGSTAGRDPVYLHDTIPAGTYRLYLVTRGPNRVTLTVPGAAAGRLSVRATTPTSYVAAESTPSGVQGRAVVPQDTVVTRFRSATRPLILGLGWAQSTSVASQAYGCATKDAPPPDATTKTPYCTEMGVTDVIEPSVDELQIYDGWYQPRAGDWQYKHVWAIEGAVTHGGSWVLQLALGAGYPTR